MCLLFLVEPPQVSLVYLFRNLPPRVDQPICTTSPFPPECLPKDLLLALNPHPEVVEPVPLPLLPIEHKRIIMPRLAVPLVHQNGMQVVRILMHTLILILYLLNLLLNLHDLLRVTQHLRLHPIYHLVHQYLHQLLLLVIQVPTTRQDLLSLLNYLNLTHPIRLFPHLINLQVQLPLLLF